MSFSAAHLRAQSVPLIKTIPVAADESFFKGALGTENEYGEFEELDDYGLGAGEVEYVALMRYGVDTLEPYEGAPSFDILGGLGMPPGFIQVLVVTPGNRKDFYDALFVGDLPEVTGGTYGVVRDTDNRWKVDFDNTTDGIVRLESIEWAQAPLGKGRVVLTFVEGA
jgi:hypothetical protein